MATAAFRSTTRRTSIGDSTSSSSSTRHRRSRSVSRFSHPKTADNAADEPELPSAVRRGKFVNTARGSEFPEISLDDLAIEMFSLSSSPSESINRNHFDESANRRGRSVVSSGDTASLRRGRSVSRRDLRDNNNNNSVVKNKNNGSDSGIGDKNGGLSRRRRSLSVAPKGYLVSDSENENFHKNRSRPDPAHTNVWDRSIPSVHKATAPHQQRGLRRCNSQKDLSQSYDGYSRKDEKKLLDLASHGIEGADSDVLEAVSNIRKNYKTKLQKSEKRKDELLAEIMLEEKRGKELKKIVGELAPNAKKMSPAKRPVRGRKRSTDRTKVHKHLIEDADKIIEDFISSFEETDISSFDDDRSDTSSIMGAFKPMMQYGDTESFKSPLRSDKLPGEMDGVALPWLKWESGVTCPLGIENKRPATPKTVLLDALEKETNGGGAQPEQSVDSNSSRGSWSPGAANSVCADLRETSRIVEVQSCKNTLLSRVPRRSRVNVDDYLKPSSNENFIAEVWRQRKRIDSGGILICNSGSSGKFLL